MLLKINAGFVFLFICATAFCPAPGSSIPVTEKWVILKDCSVTVNGSTNINKFSCHIPEYLRTDTLICNTNGLNDAVALSGKLTLPVISFDCANKLITNDLRKTLKAKEFPALHIYFLTLEKYPDVKGHETISGTVNIELAGVAKKITVNYTFSINEQKVISLAGTQSIRFSDFMLVPPRKLGGMIRTDDRLDISFVIHMKRIVDGG